MADFSTTTRGLQLLQGPPGQEMAESDDDDDGGGGGSGGGGGGMMNF